MLSPDPMSFKDNMLRHALPMLSGMGVLELSGKDAGAFAQAQFMNDVLALSPGRWHWNGWLSAKGRVLALFALARVEPDRYWLLLPDEDGETLRAALQKFVFRSKLALTVRSDRIACAEFIDTAGAGSDEVEFDAANEAGGQGSVPALAMDWSGDGSRRRLWLLPAGHPAIAGAVTGTDSRWRATDLAHGLPRLGASQREAWTPQMLSLDRLRAFSLKKGCYPGQEIVARTHYLGQAKRELVRLTGTGLIEGAAVAAGGTGIGTVVCVAANGGEGLAVLTSADDSLPLQAAGSACRRLPLLGGLQRPA